MNKKNGSKPLISVVTVVYNGEGTIEQTLKSVTEQSYKNIEYIVLDGNSNDATVDIINKYRTSIDVFKSEPDNGIYDAMNKAIDICTGDWVIFINSGDEFYTDTTIEDIEFERFSDKNLLYGKWEECDTKNNFKKTAGQRLDYPQDFILWSSFCHQAIFYKSKILKANKFDLQFDICADHDHLIKLFKNDIEAVFFKQAVSRILIGGYATQNMRKNLRERIRILKKHFDKKVQFKVCLQIPFYYVKYWLADMLKNTALLNNYKKLKYSYFKS